MIELPADNVLLQSAPLEVFLKGLPIHFCLFRGALKPPFFNFFTAPCGSRRFNTSSRLLASSSGKVSRLPVWLELLCWLQHCGINALHTVNSKSLKKWHPSGGSFRANRPNHSFGSARFGRFTSPIHLGGGFPNPEQTKFGPEQTFFVADQTKTKPKSVLPKPHANLFFKIPNHEKTLFEVCRFRVKPKPNLSSLLDPILHRV